MPYVDITSDKHATYGTHSHGEEGFATPGGTYGGQFKKNRRDHVWHPGLYSKATGPPGSEFSGNCLGDMFGCGQIHGLAPPVRHAEPPAGRSGCKGCGK